MDEQTSRPGGCVRARVSRQFESALSISDQCEHLSEHREHACERDIGEHLTRG
jgi:hypothetical protein